MNIKYTFYKIFAMASFSIVALANLSFAQGDPKTLYQKDGYKLVWADEFNENGKPNASSWRYEEGFVRNQELQWYHKAAQIFSAHALNALLERSAIDAQAAFYLGSVAQTSQTREGGLA